MVGEAEKIPILGLGGKKMKRVALTGGIACGKSLVAEILNSFGVETIDADDIVHELIPADERRRIAAKIFSDPLARKELEARIHPLVRARIESEIACAESEGRLLVAIIPLLFEVHWDEKYDIICCVTSEKEAQVSRMMLRRGWTRLEAENRLSAQLPVAEKAAKSHYVIKNNTSVEDLKKEVERFVIWLKNSMYLQTR